MSSSFSKSLPEAGLFPRAERSGLLKKTESISRSEKKGGKE